MVTFLLQLCYSGHMKIIHLNPDTMHHNPAFSQAVVVSGSSRTIYVGGQNGVGKDGKLVGEDFASQTEQAYKNVLAALAAAGATQENVVKLTIYIAQGQDIREGFAAAQKVWGMHPTAISVPIVSSLAYPGALVEIEAVAAVKEN